MTFSSREEAGQELGRYLEKQRVHADLVLGLPRGGVVVAAEVARLLQLPMGVLIVRKIGHPRNREFAVGALAEGDVVVFDQPAIALSSASQDEIQSVIAEEKERLQKYQRQFERADTPQLSDLSVLIVDDGLATGATTEAAILSARKRMARKVMVAVPVASSTAFDRIRRVADEVFAVFVDPEFDAVGHYYLHFSQTTDQEVVDILDHSRNRQ